MAVLFTILCGGVALSLGYFINYFTKGHFVHATEAAIDAEIRYLEAIGFYGEGAPANEDVIYMPLDDQGKIINNSLGPISVLSEGIVMFDGTQGQKKYAAKIHTFDDRRQLLIGLDITTVTNDFKFMQIVGGISILFIMMVVFVAYIISVFVVSNTNKIAKTAQDIIDTGDLSRRLDVTSRWDDLGNMAVVLNQLLDRIQQLMHGVRQVSDNIAHDLRTPLTRLHNQIEILENKYGHEDYADLKKETDHILNIFNALLRISRIESEKQKGQFQDVNIKDILDDVIDFYTPLAQEKNINVQLNLDKKKIHGDRDLLFQAYANIMDNAVKFTPDDGEIHVSIFDDKIAILNTGSSVDDDDIDRLFNRFYRTEESRNTPGSGLGLSMVKAVIELHDGRVEIQSNQQEFSIVTFL